MWAPVKLSIRGGNWSAMSHAVPTEDDQPDGIKFGVNAEAGVQTGDTFTADGVEYVATEVVDENGYGERIVISASVKPASAPKPQRKGKSDDDS